MATPILTSKPLPTQRAKYSQACNFCRVKKVRCEGGRPCKQCLEHMEECVFVARRRWKKNAKSGQNTVSLRLLRLESLINPPSEKHNAMNSNTRSLNSQSAGCSAQLPSQAIAAPSVWSHNMVEHVNTSHSTWPSLFLANSLEHGQKLRSETPSVQSQYQQDRPLPQNLQTSLSNTTSSKTMITAPPDTVTPSSSMLVSDTSLVALSPDQVETHEDSSLHSDEMSNWEYNGPRCFLSICSQPGINWVEGRVKVPGVRETILRFARDLTRRMKVGPGSWLHSKQRTPAPPEDLCWHYTRAFFEHTLEGISGIIDRDWFEAKLKSYLGAAEHDQDPSWYALCNTVFAFGCRMHLGKTQSYSKTVAASMGFFENALVVQPDILQSRSGLIGVRALTLMSFFTEAIGSPHLEYMLASNALRLAISKGLHRQPAVSWNLSPQEIRQRNLLFWNIYYLDRQISHRSGRPQGIDDHDISCQNPESSDAGDAVNVIFIKILVRLSQILARAYKQLSSARALRQSTKELVAAVTELDLEVANFKRSIQNLVPLDEPLNDAQCSSKMSIFQLSIIYFSYYGLLFEIHSPLSFPWLDRTRSRQLEDFRSQVGISCDAIAVAARAAILASRLIEIGPGSPVLLAIYIPCRAVVHLFTYILRDPSARTVQSDLLLLEVAAGFASRLAFATDGTTRFTFIKEFAHFASTAVEQAKNATNDTAHSVDSSETNTAEMYSAGTDADVTDRLDESHHLPELFDPNFEVDMEFWSTLVPVTSAEEMNMGIFVD